MDTFGVLVWVLDTDEIGDCLCVVCVYHGPDTRADVDIGISAAGGGCGGGARRLVLELRLVVVVELLGSVAEHGMEEG